ncbi:MAG: ATP12 family protein, partial [Litorimonas sp.]
MAKRFYTDVTLDSDVDGHFVRLDERELKTPGKRRLRVPSAAIAMKIKREWDAVPPAAEGDIDPTIMPVTRLANVASGGVADRRAALVA